MSSGLVAGDEGHRKGFRRIVLSLIWLVIVPTAALLTVGILMLVFWDTPLNIVFGILVVTLVAFLVTGTVLSLVFLGREAKLSRLQTDFVSKVSHELRTPLTSIRMFVEMLQTQKDKEQVKVCLEVLQQETERLSQRIDRLLDWGRMEAGRKIYDRRPDDLSAVLQNAIQAFRAATIGQDLPLKVHVAEGLPTLLADRGALVDAIVNLLSNAFKYSPGTPSVSLRAWVDARHVRIAVSDRGVGIPKSEHGRIFQKFYRVDDRLAREIEGSGLGLAIVRHVAHAHGGRVEVDSAPGEGSTFTLVLPRTDRPKKLSGLGRHEESDRPPNAASHESGSPKADASTAGSTIATSTASHADE